MALLKTQGAMNFSGINNLPAYSPNGILNIIIETPKGSRNKFNFDTRLDLFKLKKILPAGAVFPFDFGFVPETLGDDGDPLDVLLLIEEPVFSGCLVPARLVGVIEAMQIKDRRKERNDRLIAIANKSEVFGNVASLADLNPKFLEQIEHFFISYNQIEGKQFKPLKRSGPKSAARLIKQGQQAYLAHAKQSAPNEK